MHRDFPSTLTLLCEVSVEEVATRLSVAEGRPVTINEVRLIERQALTKLRRLLVERGFTPGNLLPDR